MLANESVPGCEHKHIYDCVCPQPLQSAHLIPQMEVTYG